jgi:hypothetical protein
MPNSSVAWRVSVLAGTLAIEVCRALSNTAKFFVTEKPLSKTSRLIMPTLVLDLHLNYFSHCILAQKKTGPTFGFVCGDNVSRGKR